ncbi:MAG TPA: hypothetical protein VMF89_19615 [Polyangiales bacterium]|nr:hypothetical protein [Polyangiales bacterium]
MSRRPVITLCMAIAGTSLFGTEAAYACPPSGWGIVQTPDLRCLRITGEVEDIFEVHNDCTAAVEIKQVECGGRCSETLRIAPGAKASLELPMDPEDAEERVYEYTLPDQTGTTTFTYELNACPSESSGVCSLASPRARSTVIQIVGLSVVMMLIGRRRRARRRT